MSVLDWLFTGLLSCGILFFLFSLSLVFASIQTRRELKQVKKRSPKGKKRKKKWRRHCQKLKKKANKRLVGALALVVLCGTSIGSAAYARYYQLTNLNNRDKEMLVQSYFLIDELEEELVKIQNGANPEKSEEKLLNRTSLLITYTGHEPSQGLSVEGQRLLKRYYNSARELGVNMNAQRGIQYKEADIVERYLADIQKVRARQQEVFEAFQINQAALKQNK